MNYRFTCLVALLLLVFGGGQVVLRSPRSKMAVVPIMVRCCEPSSEDRNFDLGGVLADDYVLSHMGGPAAFLNTMARAAMLEQLTQIAALQPDKVVEVTFVSHADCLAIGRSKDFASPDAEVEHHREVHRKAAVAIREILPAARVRGLLHTRDRLLALE